MRAAHKVNPNFFFNKKNEVYDRSLRVTKSLIGKRISIYNGKIFISLLIRDYHIGGRFGQFIKTKRKGSVIHNRNLGKKGKK